MLKNFLVTAFRNLWRHKFFSFINILGLTIGLSASLVLFMIVFYEFSHNQFITEKDNTYRIVMKTKSTGGFEGYSGAVPAPLGNAIVNNVMGVKEVIPIFSFPGDSQVDVSVPNPSGGKDISFKKQEGVYFADQAYTRLLGYQWLAGDPASALEQPFQVVLTQSRATMYFPRKKLAEIIGSNLRYGELNTRVTGIINDLDKPSDFHGKEFISLKTTATGPLKEALMMDNWNDWMGYSKLLITLMPNIDPEKVANGLNLLYNKHQNQDNYFSSINFNLVPLTDMHFDFRCQSHDARIVNRSTLYGLIAIATFLLLLACINYINLTTAQVSQRAKEVGIRKTIGSSRKQLIIQFLGETFIITSIATALGVLFIPLLLKLFSSFVPEGLHISFLWQIQTAVFFLALILLLTLFAGIYPAFMLSRYKPLQVIKNTALITFGQSRQTLIRRVLTVFQFTIAQFFIICTLMIGKQLYFVLHADMGFQKEAILTFHIPRDSIQPLKLPLLHRLQSIPGIEIVSNGFTPPAMEGGAFANLSYHNGSEEIKPNAQIRWGDENYCKIYHIPIIAGRTVTPSDSISELVVNESFTKELGFQHAQEALGKFVNYNGKNVPIVGIMKDFHVQSFRAKIMPVIFASKAGSTFHIKLQARTAGNTWQKTIAQIQSIFKEHFPEEDFNYAFVDESVAKFYEEDQRTATLLRYATGFTIFISLLGLFGLVLYTTNNRIKEVGIRKVLGASVSQLITLLSRDFVWLIVLAFIIASPLAWWAITSWLNNFPYRTTVNWWIFLSSGCGTILLATALLSVHTYRAANVNPVDSLRNE